MNLQLEQLAFQITKAAAACQRHFPLDDETLQAAREESTDAALRAQAGLIEWTRGNRGHAQTHLRRAVELADAPTEQGRYAFWLADMLRLLGQHDEALPLFWQAARLLPSPVIIWSFVAEGASVFRWWLRLAVVILIALTFLRPLPLIALVLGTLLALCIVNLGFALWLGRYRLLGNSVFTLLLLTTLLYARVLAEQPLIRIIITPSVTPTPVININEI